MKFSELDAVALTQDIPAIEDALSVGAPNGMLPAGTIGTIVHVCVGPDEAYLVEFVDQHGQTMALPTLSRDQIRAADRLQVPGKT